MIFELVGSKVQYVQDRLKGLQLNALKTEMHRICGANVASDTLQETLAVEFLYLLEKHKRWRHLDLFRELTQEYLTSSYRITAEIFTDLWTLFEEVASPPPSNPQRTEEDFFVWLIASSALADGGAKLLLEIGLGRQLIARLKRAAARVFNPEPPQAATYLTTLDERLLAVTSRLTREAKRLPWSLELHRLRYTLDSLPEPWQTIAEESDIGFVHRILAFVGQQSGPKESEILQAASIQIEGMRELPNLEATFHALLVHLQAQGFIHLLQGGSARSGHRRWQLTELGERSSAHLFAAAWQDGGGDREALLRHSDSYQVAALEREDLQDGSIRTFYLAQIAELKPRALRFLVRRLHRIVDSNEIAEAILKGFSSAQVPWKKQALVEALAGFRTMPKVRLFLGDVAQCDGSTLVRKTAETMLRLEVLESKKQFSGTGSTGRVGHEEGTSE